MSVLSIKKIVTLLLITSALFALMGCQSEDSIDATTSEVAQEVTTQATEATTEVEPFIVSDFELIGLDGTKSSLYAYKGQRIVLNFWATWCGFCVEEMPLLDEMDQRDDVTVIAISVGEEAETVKKYIEEGGYGFDVFLDKEGTLASKFGVTGFPTSLFIGTDFEFFYSYPGMLTQETFDSVFKAIDDIIKERSGL